MFFANLLSCEGLEEYLNCDIDVLGAYPSFPKSGITKPSYCADLFVDSGAFGKYSHLIKIKDYIRFLKINQTSVDIYTGLDVIGDPETTQRNQDMMERKELNPIPTFHFGSDEKWLKEMVAKEYKYIAIGGLVGRTANQVVLWLDYIWSTYLTDSFGDPIIKIHGFGIQDTELISRYPWYSLDASSVHMQARYGGIKTPWGWMKINPNVSSKEMEWQIKRPEYLVRVKEFTEKYGDNKIDFKLAQSQTTEGTLARCALSIHYILDLINKIKCEKFLKSNFRKPLV